MSFASWGRVKSSKSQVLTLAWPKGLDKLIGAPKGPHLAVGLGRSYGDSCILNAGTLLKTANLNRWITADWQSGEIWAEAGLSLAELLQIAVPRGFWPPVTPGTKFVSLGGAVANDVHGKNHHGAGTIGRHITGLKIWRSDRGYIHLDPQTEPELFRATIGGLGLTGVILAVGLRLKAQGSMIEQETQSFGGLQDFIDLSKKRDSDFEYTVAWVDTTARGAKMGRGIYMGGRGLDPKKMPPKLHREPRLSFPCAAPSGMLNAFSVRAFNELYYHAKARSSGKTELIHYEPFFYPLDAIGRWNLMYGPQGFYQHQCIIPFGKEAALENMLAAISDAREASFLAVLKVFGGLESPGLMSFPRPGYTLALDFRNRGAQTMVLLRKLDEIVAAAGGRLYPAKDAHMAADFFKASYPQWTQLEPLRDPGLNSDFWQRMETHGSFKRN